MKSEVPTYGNHTPAENNLVLDTVRMRCKVVVPTNAVILQASSGRDTFQWTLFAAKPEEFIMPKEGNDFGGSYQTDKPDDGVNIIETILKIHIKNPVVMVSSVWDTDKYQFSAFVVKTSDGEYLHLNQFSGMP